MIPTHRLPSAGDSRARRSWPVVLALVLFLACGNPLSQDQSRIGRADKENSASPARVRSR
jgi:hypothetical protein